MMERGDVRASSAICTLGEVASLTGTKTPTLRSWTRPRGTRPSMVHTITPIRRGWPTVPLVGLAEASSLRALRHVLTMPKVVAAVEFIRDQAGDEFALANPQLVTDGSEAYLHSIDTDELVRIPDGQGAITDVVRTHLRPLILGPDGYVAQFRVERFHASEVLIDPEHTAGRMYFTRTGVPLFAVAGALRAGERSMVVADDFGLTLEEVTEVESNLEWLGRVA